MFFFDLKRAFPSIISVGICLLAAGCASHKVEHRLSPIPSIPATSTATAASAQKQAATVPASGKTEKTNEGAGPALRPGEEKPLFDGKTLAGWKITDFAGPGPVEVKDGEIILNSGAILTGVTYTNSVPKSNFEISLEAEKLDGSDFFCGLTFPVGNSHCTFVVGGWVGSVVGISSVDSADASENETTKFMGFKKNQWYKIRVRVMDVKIQAWIDDEQLVDLVTTDRRISMRLGEIEASEPLGIAAYQTTAALRNIKIRSLAK